MFYRAICVCSSATSLQRPHEAGGLARRSRAAFLSAPLLRLLTTNSREGEPAHTAVPGDQDAALDWASFSDLRSPLRGRAAGASSGATGALESADAGPPAGRSAAEVEAAIVEVLETKAAPAIRSDGGDISFQSFDPLTGVVRVRLHGACVSCGSSTTTLRFMVQRALTFYVPEVTAVARASDEEERAVERGMRAREIKGVGEAEEEGGRAEGGGPVVDAACVDGARRAGVGAGTGAGAAMRDNG